MSPSPGKRLLDPLVFALLLGAAGEPRADADVTPPLPIPGYYRSECGTCHVPYPPNLLPAGGFFSGSGWHTVMQDLRAHYGDDATLDEPTRQRIEQYLVDNAAPAGKRFRALADPPRLTTTLWFHRNHGTVRKQFADAAVGSAANCSACHPDAEQWSYTKKTQPQQTKGALTTR